MQFAGLDGCRGGWIAVIINQYNGKPPFVIQKVLSIDDFIQQFPDCDRIFIDIPIGLRDAGGNPRNCDLIARQLLHPQRTSSIFTPPCRQVLAVKEYPEANLVNRLHTGKGLSKQTWNIIPKIKEIDTFLHSHKRYIEILYESHPEVCFWALNNHQAIDFYKKSIIGREERLEILAHYSTQLENIVEEFLYNNKSSQFCADDVIDAAVLAYSVSLPTTQIRNIPEPPETDSTGLPMRICYSEPVNK